MKNTIRYTVRHRTLGQILGLVLTLVALSLLGACGSQSAKAPDKPEPSSWGGEDLLIQVGTVRSNQWISAKQKELIYNSPLADQRFRRLKSEAIGSYSNGCLKNGVRIPDKGPGYVLSPVRRTHRFAHPLLKNFIGVLGKWIEDSKSLNVVIGDLSSRNGGSLGGSHLSHQTGLDADIWFNTLGEVENPLRELRILKPLSAVNLRMRDVNRAVFTDEVEDIIRVIVKSPMVQRVFVDRIIKTNLCQSYAGEDWLKKLRPWKRHSTHFHVRLHCPKSDARCLPQPEPVRDDCDQLLKSVRKIANSEDGNLDPRLGTSAYHEDDEDEENEGNSKRPKACRSLLTGL